MPISPISENQAESQVRGDYEKIKKALDLPYVPLFFTYIGSFPEYLRYLTDQLVPNLQDPKFTDLSLETEKRILTLIRSSLPQSEEMQEWLIRYQNSPSFYNFQFDLKKIFTVNIKLVFIFVALREALKGWAIAAKKLPTSGLPSDRSQKTPSQEKDFIFEEVLSLVPTISPSASDAVKAKARAIEKDLLPRYITLCQQEFYHLMKQEEFLILRVGIEKLILSSLTFIPDKIVSPINMFYKLNERYKDFPDLLYLMYEHFPTFAVQKMMFSGFMKNS